MQTSNNKIIKNMTLILIGALLPLMNTAWAESDMKLQEKALMARELSRKQAAGITDHSEHMQEADVSTNYRGVFFGYLPCKEKDCDGLKMTLSLKQKSNYLLVSQYAKASSREYFDKGKYIWDDETHTLSLTSNKDDLKRKFIIKDEGTLTLLNSDGKPMPGDQDDYTLSRSDKAKSREVHIH
ncbi:copper resistance protein NlpE [Methylomonas sp. AM2-LC]|uniref:copper resistance protein NlpE n=1 Tax=Methylomonas sp. AM2-LC TaxID=3153301 RepID=UPI0032630339